MRPVAIAVILLSTHVVGAVEMSHEHQHSMPMPPHAQNSQSEGNPSVDNLTDAEREAAFPDLGAMDLRRMMDTPLLAFTQAERLEWFEADGETAWLWDVGGWVGKDKHRFWWRSEGEHADRQTQEAELQLLYGRPIARWWDVVVGMRHDFPKDVSRSWLAAGIQGLAPYWFETELTLFFADDGQSQIRLQWEYELLLTQRLILQPQIELNAFGQDQPRHLEAAGLARSETGLRLRYELRREFAPYLGVRWESKHGRTASLLRSAGNSVADAAWVAGLRLWF